MKKIQKKSESVVKPVMLDKKTTKMIKTNFKTLETTIEGLQQELQETLTYMELRLENLEMVVAEIQAELHKQAKTNNANSRSYFH